MTDEEICKAVKEVLRSRGITIIWLSGKTGIDYVRLQRCLNAEMPLRAAEYEKIKYILGIQ